MPFAGYKDFDECVSQNQDKDDPEAYCGAIKHKTEKSQVFGSMLLGLTAIRKRLRK